MQVIESRSLPLGYLITCFVYLLLYAKRVSETVHASNRKSLAAKVFRIAQMVCFCACKVIEIIVRSERKSDVALLIVCRMDVCKRVGEIEVS